MSERPTIDPALGLDLVENRTLTSSAGHVSVIIPAHNEQDTIAEVITQCQQGIDRLSVPGDVLVSASGCTDATEQRAREAGAGVVIAPIGKGAAIMAGVAAAEGDILCLVDGDIKYFGDPPLVTILVEPILKGIADACISDLYWRPLYPQMWLHAFFAPLTGAIYPELLPKVGSTPWSGQRAARRDLWPSDLPEDFTADLALLLYWNLHATRLRPILADDWVNPQRPKPDLMEQELDVLLRYAMKEGRISEKWERPIRQWFEATHHFMADYRPGEHQPQAFEQYLLTASMTELRRQLAGLPD